MEVEETLETTQAQEIDETADVVVEEVEIAETVQASEEEVATTATKAVVATEIFKSSETVKPKTEVKEKKAPREAKEVYVSKFEKLADPTVALERLARDQQRAAQRNLRQGQRKDEFEEKEIELEYEIAPEYTQEELDEIERKRLEEESSWIEDEIDFEEFEDFYEN